MDLYPKLCVCDGRVTGSITTGRSRLPLWTIIGIMMAQGWEDVVDSWPEIEADFGWTRDDMADFLYYLLEQRGELARLLLVLADAERQARLTNDPFWAERPDLRTSVKEQLKRCLEVLEQMEKTEGQS